MSNRKDTQLKQHKVKPPTRLVVLNPSKGLNNLVSPSLIDNREFSDSLNIEYDEGGVARKRSGYLPVGGALTAAKGLGAFTTEVVRYVVTVDGTHLKYLNGTAWSTATGATLTTAKETTFTQARNNLFVWNGTDGGSYFDGTALTRPGTMPKAKFAIFYQDKHIASGVDGQPNRLYISSISDATDFTVATGGTPPQPDNATDVPGATVFAGTPGLTEANIIDVRKNDGDKITGIGKFQDQIIIFKERSIFSLTFDDSGKPIITPITEATGCVSHKSIENVENDLYFLSREGQRVLGNEPQYFSAVRTSVLSIRVQPILDNINYTYYSKCNAHYWDNKYIMGIPTANSTIDHCLVYDRRFQAYSYWDSINPNSMIVFDDVDGKEHFYFMSDTGTQMYEIVKENYNDAGVAINAYFVAKAQDFGNPDITKFWIDLGLVFRRLIGSVDVTIYEDNGNMVGSGSTTVGGGTLNGMGLAEFGMFMFGDDAQMASNVESFVDNPERIGLNINSRTLKYKIGNNKLNEAFVFLGTIYAVYPASHFLFDSSRKIYI